ncbi:MAG: RHS repeat protein [Azoarcus sp.]|jgi:YD repeat-containing protein|nr:RHS repeat protein [Azoarcus sp.]
MVRRYATTWARDLQGRIVARVTPDGAMTAYEFDSAGRPAAASPKRERMDFAQEESGKTIYFCVRYENAKGEPGPWGPIFSAVIP